MSIKQKTTRPLPRDISLEVWYRKRLLRHLKAMSNNAQKEILSAWQNKEAEITKDAGAARTLADVIRSLKYNWKNQFSKLSDQVAREFTRRAEKGTTRHLKNLLKEVGFGVNFKNSRDINNILQATIAENVNLIRSIQPYYFTQVETVIMQGIKNGRDLGYMAKELQDRFGVAERRAVIIARDQTNKATGAISRARSREAGIEYAVWRHIGGKKTDRSTHEAMNGKVFSLEHGMYDPKVKRHIMPGELINCNCKYRILIPDVGQESGLPFYNSKPSPLPLKQQNKGKQSQALRPYVQPQKNFADYENNASSLQAAAKAYFDENLKDTELTTGVLTKSGKVQPLTVVFAGSTWQKIKEHMNKDSVRPRLVPELPQILQGIGKEEAPYKDHKFAKFYKFEGMALGQYHVEVKVGERNSDGVNAVHSMVNKKATSDALSARQVPSATQGDTVSGFPDPVAARVASDASKKKIKPIFEIVNIKITKV